MTFSSVCCSINITTAVNTASSYRDINKEAHRQSLMKSIRLTSNMTKFIISFFFFLPRDGSGFAVPRPSVSDRVHKDDSQSGTSEAEQLC